MIARPAPTVSLERLNVDLCTEIQQGIESGDALPAEDVFAELNARYAEPGRPAGKSGSKRRA